MTTASAGDVGLTAAGSGHTVDEAASATHDPRLLTSSSSSSSSLSLLSRSRSIYKQQTGPLKLRFNGSHMKVRSKFPFSPIHIPAFPFPIQFPGFFPHHSHSHLTPTADSHSLCIPIPGLTERRLHSVSRSTYTKWASEMREHNKHVEIWTNGTITNNLPVPLLLWILSVNYCKFDTIQTVREFV